MKNIKFRAWNTVDKKWYSGYKPDIDLYLSMDGKIYETDINRKLRNLVPVDRYIIQQYIRIDDKNGKEIYEGDIVNLYFSYEKENRYYVVTDIHYFCGDNGYESRDIEIVGNIFETPELLKETK